MEKQKKLELKSLSICLECAPAGLANPVVRIYQSELSEKRAKCINCVLDGLANPKRAAQENAQQSE